MDHAVAHAMVLGSRLLVQKRWVEFVGFGWRGRIRLGVGVRIRIWTLDDLVVDDDAAAAAAARWL